MEKLKSPKTDAAKKEKSRGVELMTAEELWEFLDNEKTTELILSMVRYGLATAEKEVSKDGEYTNVTVRDKKGNIIYFLNKKQTEEISSVIFKKK